MTKHIHVRHFDGKYHRILSARAAKTGLSLSEYVRQELGKLASRPTPEEFARSIVDLPREMIATPWSSKRTVRILHEGREQRDEQIALATNGSFSEP